MKPMKPRRFGPLSPFWVTREKKGFTTADYTTNPGSELIHACADGDEVAWQEFISRFHRIIVTTASRAPLGRELPDAGRRSCAGHISEAVRRRRPGLARVRFSTSGWDFCVPEGSDGERR